VKRILFVLSFLIVSAVAAGTLLADDNLFVGTWKLNAAKSKSMPSPLPKSLTRTITAQGDSVKYSFEGVAADGSPISYSFTTKYDGMDSPVTGSGMPGGADSINLKLVNPHKTEGVSKKAGKEIGKTEAELSKDGKTATVKSKGKSADGKEYDSVTVYDKQ
jgi:hypothetical protein